MCADSTFADFRRDHAAAIRGNPNTTVTVHNTAFKRLTITPRQKPDEDPVKWGRIFGSAVGLFENALLWLQVLASDSLCHVPLLKFDSNCMHMPRNACGVTTLVLVGYQTVRLSFRTSVVDVRLYIAVERLLWGLHVIHRSDLVRT